MIEELTDQALNWCHADLERVARAIAPFAVRTPLIPSVSGLMLKPELLQPLGSFKIRCAAAVLVALRSETRAVATASAGNFAQGLTALGVARGLAVTVHVPHTAPRVKTAAIDALGGRVVTHNFGRWWEILVSGATGLDDGMFVHPFANPRVLMGDASVGLEIAADLPSVQTVVVPFGGGGLAVGIALALRACGSKASVVACEIATAAPLSAALAAGHPMTVVRSPSFVDGIGSTRVLDAMWPLVRALIDGVITVTPAEAAKATRDLAFDAGLIGEGAAAVAYAAATKVEGSVVAVLTGRNIDRDLAIRLIDKGHA